MTTVGTFGSGGAGKPTRKVPLVAPSGIETVAVTVATCVLELERATVTPPLEAGLVKMTVPTEVENKTFLVTVVTEKVSAAKLGFTGSGLR